MLNSQFSIVLSKVFMIGGVILFILCAIIVIAHIYALTRIYKRNKKREDALDRTIAALEARHKK